MQDFFRTNVCNACLVESIFSSKMCSGILSLNSKWDMVILFMEMGAV